MDEAATHRPDPAALVTTATLGSHTDKPLHPRDLPASGVGLTGPGAPAAARGLLASVLSAGGPWSPGAQATLITTADDLAGILPGAADRAADLERLHVADTVTAALDELERQLLRRARLASDLDDLTPDSEHADDVLAPAVFLTTAPAASLGTRLTAILTVGARLGVVAVLLGTWPAGQTWQVHTDGTTTVDGQPHGGGPRLNVLDDAAALDILDTVRQVHPTTDDLPPAPPRAATTTVAPAHNAAGEQAPPPTHQQPAATPPPRGAASVPSRRRRLHLTVLGKPIIALVNGARRTELRIRRSAGMQILIYLAVNPNGATSDELMTVLWPAIRPRYARGSFHTTISELRHHLAEAISGDQPDEQPGVEPIPRTDERYHLDTRHVDVDLWAFNATVDQAATAVQPGEHAAALRKIISLYTGAVADGHSWLWLAPYRETTRRHVLDAYVALADTEPEPRQALVLIQDAIRLEPYNEDLYQRAIRLHARLGSPNGVRRTLHTLSERLAELEIPVSAQTQQVATDVLQRLDLRQRATNSTF